MNMNDGKESITFRLPIKTMDKINMIARRAGVTPEQVILVSLASVGTADINEILEQKNNTVETE